MSVEIREIVIRANITPPGTPVKDQKDAADDRRAIVEECTNRVLSKLRKRPRR